MLWRMLRTLVLMGIARSFAWSLLQAFVLGKIAHG